MIRFPYVKALMPTRGEPAFIRAQLAHDEYVDIPLSPREAACMIEVLAGYVGQWVRRDWSDRRHDETHEK